MEKNATEDGLDVRPLGDRPVDGRGAAPSRNRVLIDPRKALALKKAKCRPSEGIRRAYQRLTAPFDSTLSMSKTEVLQVLYQHGTLYQRQITELTGIDRSTLSDLLKRMATDGLVANARLESDSRAVQVTITPAGRKAFLRVEKVLALSEDALLNLIPKADRAAFLRGLKAICEAE